MEREKKNVTLGGSCQFVKRAITWEISDSEGSSDVEPQNSSDAAVQGNTDRQNIESCRKLEAKEVSLLTSLPQRESCNSNPKKKKKQSLKKAKMAQTNVEDKMVREHKKEEKTKRKEQMALEKERRKEATATLKSLRPDQCMKQMIVCVDSGLLEHLGSDILLEALDSLDCKYSIERQTVTCSITWQRKIFSNMPGTDGPWEKAEAEREVLFLMQPSDFLRRLFSLTQEGPSTASYSVAVIGLDAYQWYNQHHRLLPEQRMVDPIAQQLGPEWSMTPHEIEEALVVLQLWGNVSVLFLETWQELAEHVSAMTRAIAQRPYKKLQDRQPFSFCTKGKWAGGVHVAKDGKGLQETWLKQIQQFNRVSPAQAGAIAQAYPSPALLIQAYQECRTEKDRLLLLSNIPVRTEDKKKERRVGPDLSRRIYLFMVSTNPELVLDLSA